MLELRDVHVYYGLAWIIKGISLRVPANSVVAVLGLNGAGKTTLLHSIMGFVPPRDGQILLQGRDVSGLPPHAIAQRGIALVPQGRRIFASLTVKECLMIAQRKANGHKWTLSEIWSLFPALQGRLHHRGGELSGGEQQMLAWARALLANPSLLLMDEPTEGLAPVLVRAIRDMIPTLKNKGMTILLAEQNVDFAAAVADTIHIVANGQLSRTFSQRELQDGQVAGKRGTSLLSEALHGFGATADV